MDFDRVSQTGGRLFERPGSDIRITGYMKKFKTMKKKFFILRSTSSSGPARLEYYDSEKKFNAGHQPKRSIHLHNCFNINRKSDGRHKCAIALYTNEECFSVVCDNERELDMWLSGMLEFQNEYVRDDERCREHYEHVWQVTVQPKGLGQTKNLRGPYRLCMTRHSVCLVKLNSDNPQYVFQLETVRTLAHSENLFRLEVGKIAPTGDGELWMQADDSVTAQNLHETILNYMKNMHSSRPSEFRPRTVSESQGSRTRPKIDQRPASVYTHDSKSTSRLHSAVSPSTSPHAPSFEDHGGIMGGHRLRSDSNDSKTSRSSIPIFSDDPIFADFPHIPYGSDIALLEEEPDFDQRSLPSSPGSHLTGEFDDCDSHPYIPMHPGSATSASGGYMSMAPGSQRDSMHSSMEAPNSYMPMNPSCSSASAPIPIHFSLDATPGYMDMTPHTLPPVREGSSSEGYVPMSPSYSASPSGSSSSHLRPDTVVCLLRDDVTIQPPLRTNSLGSRPVKTGTTKYQGYMDMTVRQGVSDKDRSCSAPHLITHHHHHGHSYNRPTGHASNVDSPTPSASPLSVSLCSDDSDSFMEFDFYRPRTASDSYSYRPRASTFGVQQKVVIQGHRPRSSSHGQGTRPVRGRKLMGMDAGRLSQELLQRTSLNSSSHASFDSLRVSSSESLRKLSLEVRAKTSQLNKADYMDMGFEKRSTPSPLPGSLAGKSAQNGYVDMTLSTRKSSSPGHTRASSRSSSKTNSVERLQDADYTNMSLGGGDHHHHHHEAGTRDSVYMNVEGHEAPAGQKKHDSPSRTSPADESYIPYEPAITTGSGTGVGAKSDSVSPDPRNRSGSGGKEHKKWSFFSLRHGHADSTKTSGKRSDSHQQQQQQSRSGSLGGVGDRIVSLGHDIRRKSKDAQKGGRQKSASFSRLLESRQAADISGGLKTKQGKPSRKVPTPPRGSEDMTDEYIEFAPMVAKSDSDSSHSSGSTRGSRRKEDVFSAKAEPEYVGFEPGSIPSAKSGGDSKTSCYVPMGNAPRIGGQSSVFKPVQPSRKSENDESKGKKEATTSASAMPRETTFQPVHSYAPPKSTPTAAPGGEVSKGESVSTSLLSATSALGLSEVNRGERVSTSSAQSQPYSPPSPQTQTLLPPSKVSPTPVTSESRSKSATPTGSAHSPCSTYSPGSSLSTIPTPSSSESSVISVTLKSSIHKASESGYMDFDPGKPSTTATSTESSSDSVSAINRPTFNRGGKDKSAGSKEKQVLPSGPVISPMVGPLPVLMEVPHSSREQLQSPSTVSPVSEAPASSVPVGKMVSAASVQTKQATGGKSQQSPPSPSVTSEHGMGAVCKGVSDASPTVAGRGVASQEVCVRNFSGGKIVVRPGSVESASDQSVKEPSSAGNDGIFFKQGDAKGRSASSGDNGDPQKRKEGKPSSPRGVLAATGPNLIRPESTPSLQSLSKPGVGRGRHCSAGSKPTGEGTNGSKSGGGEVKGSLHINTEAEARHSVTDLSGYEQMVFPSNALSRQQPVHTINRQTHTQSTSSAGSTASCQGVLNYATLDLGSADSIGESGDTDRSPRNKSRHPSSADERGDALSYATIDFEKSESLRNSANKDVKFTL